MSGLQKSVGISLIRAGEKGNELRLLVLEKRPLLENVPASGVLHQWRALVQRAQVSPPARSDRRESVAGMGMSVHRSLATATTAAKMARWQPRALPQQQHSADCQRAPLREQGGHCPLVSGTRGSDQPFSLHDLPWDPLRPSLCGLGSPKERQDTGLPLGHGL